MNIESVVRTLRAYDASFDAAAVRAALADSSSTTDLVRWAALHLTPDTLLTVDELNQYAVLEESGVAERLASMSMSSDVTAARVLSDQEIRDAIQELDRSTEAITRQTEALRQQQEAFGRLVGAIRGNSEERGAAEVDQARKWEAGRKAVASEVDDLTQSLGARVGEVGQHNTAGDATIRKLVDTLLSSDDKLLSSLQKLGWELETEDDEEQRDVTLLRETCARLIKFTVEGTRTKLDRLYLESLEESQDSQGDRVSADEVSTLQGELESLYAEILPVAQMSTEQQFLEPALKSIATKNGLAMARSGQATSYIHECLDYLIDRAQDLMARLDAFQSYKAAAGAVLDVANVELDVRDSNTEALLAPKSNLRQQDFISPVKPKPKARPRYSVGAAGIAKEPPLDEILRMLAISAPQDEEDSVGPEGQVKELASTLAMRRAKMQDVALNVQETFESVATKQLADGKLAIQLLRDSVLAESPYGDVRLVDPEIEGSIGVLSQELVNVDEKLKGVEVGVEKLKGRNVKRDEFISRWGS
ncbi:uncharacterized protein C8A04DRAFT_37678 [Dichotomopilus funicola]|uniref:Uncharacterized protein n=1 Tax=Dichotomopilus funicola TaxID=1934379 RepID=A0AAN6V2A6_9PEZI|nr:hypothetical protein C8A04DRAFT_37678 [Dichotomopilus funicola]